jgi:crotonobetainyl-CoA:carnitine CoA-transferase CaiB-like acyl-CoA transferase
MGRIRYYHPDPIKLSAAEPDVCRPVMLGEHTEKVCTEILGMAPEEVERLRQKGVFE